MKSEEYISLIQENIQISPHGLHPSPTPLYTPEHIFKITEWKKYNEDDFPVSFGLYDAFFI